VLGGVSDNSGNIVCYFVRTVLLFPSPCLGLFDRDDIYITINRKTTFDYVVYESTEEI